MNLDDYQKRAFETDHFSRADPRRRMSLGFLGLAESVGKLSNILKEEYRQDREPSPSALLPIAESLGDLLWYVAVVAQYANLSLEEVAKQNLEKTHARWGVPPTNQIEMDLPKLGLFDEAFPSEEQLPRQLEVKLEHVHVLGRTKLKMSINASCGWLQLGDPLTDNNYEDDGYRFHDVFHMAYVAKLGWSPVIRSLLKRKRKSSARIDEVEDGARAGDLEEGLTAYLFQHAKEHDYFKTADHVPTWLLIAVRQIVAHLEVGKRTLKDWEDAILTGYRVFDQVRSNSEGILRLDMNKRTLEFEPTRPHASNSVRAVLDR